MTQTQHSPQQLYYNIPWDANWIHEKSHTYYISIMGEKLFTYKRGIIS
jgi:hypothetical protein